MEGSKKEDDTSEDGALSDNGLDASEYSDFSSRVTSKESVHDKSDKKYKKKFKLSLKTAKYENEEKADKKPADAEKRDEKKAKDDKKVAKEERKASKREKKTSKEEKTATKIKKEVVKADKVEKANKKTTMSYNTEKSDKKAPKDDKNAAKVGKKDTNANKHSRHEKKSSAVNPLNKPPAPKEPNHRGEEKMMGDRSGEEADGQYETEELGDQYDHHQSGEVHMNDGIMPEDKLSTDFLNEVPPLHSSMSISRRIRTAHSYPLPSESPRRVRFTKSGHYINSSDSEMSHSDQSENSFSSGEEEELEKLEEERSGSSGSENQTQSISGLNRSNASLPASESGITPRITHSRTTTANELAIHRRATALTLAVMLMTLLSCSASQLRMQLAYPHNHSYTNFVYSLIGTCIAFEILSGFMYIFLSRYDFAEHIVEHVYTALIFCLFVITITSLFTAAFTADDSICKMLKID